MQKRNKEKDKSKKIDICGCLKRMPISTKITVVYAAVFSVILIMSTSFLLINAWFYYRNTSKEEINDVLKTIEEYILGGGEVTNEKIAQINTNKYIDVRVIKRGDAEPNGMKPPRFFDDGTQKNGIHGEKGFDVKMIQNKPYMYAQRLIKMDSQVYIVEVYRLYSAEKKVLNIFIIIFLFVNLLSVAVAYFAGKYISDRFLKPIKEISSTAKNISIYDLEQRIQVPEADDEIKDLAITFNEMIARLQDSFEKQNMFISDASHELRTPIAVIQGYADLIDRWGKDDKEVFQESITAIRVETNHMKELINQLLFLARGMKAAKTVNMQPICLNAIAEEVVKEISITNSHVDIGLEAEGVFYINADEVLIKQLLRIFAENSIKYRKKESCIITIKVSSEGGCPCVAVSDNGMGICSEDIPHIFDRFFRGDKSRNKEISGNGLGLSIAKWIIDSHSAKVEVFSKVGEGSTFKVVFENQ